MSTSLRSPGVYLEESASGSRPIAGAPTSITAFVGPAPRGPVDRPVPVQSFADFERAFGGLSRSSPVSYAVRQFFENGGTHGVVVRVAGAGTRAATGSAGGLALIAASAGSWGSHLRVRIEHDARSGADERFHLTVRDGLTGATERFLGLSVRPDDERNAERVLEAGSALLRIRGALPESRPPATPTPLMRRVDPMTVTPGSIPFEAGGSDGDPVGDAEISDPALREAGRGLWALEHEPIFNLLCIPPFDASGKRDVGAQTRAAAAAYCEARRAIFLADPLASWELSSQVAADVTGGADTTWGLEPSANVALYFPYVVAPDPLQEGRPAPFAPSGAVAGIIARTDAERGVWSSPSGTSATLRGIADLRTPITDREQESLTPLGVNCVRAFRESTPVLWGARTLLAADSAASEWKYLSVRRLALFIEVSLVRGLQWVAFEPNDAPLWTRVRRDVEDFLTTLWRGGALVGTTTDEAFFVRCGRDTTTQADIDGGALNVVVGIAPLKPADFVVVTIRCTSAGRAP